MQCQEYDLCGMRFTSTSTTKEYLGILLGQRLHHHWQPRKPSVQRLREYQHIITFLWFLSSQCSLASRPWIVKLQLLQLVLTTFFTEDDLAFPKLAAASGACKVYFYLSS
jgi:hypothetical protein